MDADNAVALQRTPTSAQWTTLVVSAVAIGAAVVVLLVLSLSLSAQVRAVQDKLASADATAGGKTSVIAALDAVPAALPTFVSQNLTSGDTLTITPAMLNGTVYVANSAANNGNFAAVLPDPATRAVGDWVRVVLAMPSDTNQNTFLLFTDGTTNDSAPLHVAQAFLQVHNACSPTLIPDAVFVVSADGDGVQSWQMFGGRTNFAC